MIERIKYRSQKEHFPRSRLPEFTQGELLEIKGSADFLGLNHYSTSLTWEPKKEIGQIPSLTRDTRIYKKYDPSWPSSEIEWLKDVPWGMYKTLIQIKNLYNNPVVIVHENGWSEKALEDTKRIHYMKGYIENVSKAIKDGCNVKGYLYWSFLDNFEWLRGYTQKFGLYHVNFTDPMRPRTPRLSVKWYKEFIESNMNDNI